MTLRYKRVVVKLGTSTLTHESGQLNLRRIDQLARAASDINNMGAEVIVVSSGAVGVGVSRLGLHDRPDSTPGIQAAAAVGQCTLMHIYDKFFGEYGHTVAQLLLTRDVIDNDITRRNVTNTFNQLFEYGVIPIVNENDPVSTNELQHITCFGDNDTLSAIVSTVCGADLLIILSDIDGLYDANPKNNKDARLIPLVTDITPEIISFAGGSGTDLGTGGMKTKLSAAQIAMEHGIDMIITNGVDPSVILDICAGQSHGTLFRSPRRA